MTEAEFVAIAKRPPNERERRWNHIVDTPADALHAPSAAFFDLPQPGGAVNDHPQLPWPWPKSAPTEREILRFIANSTLEHNALVRRIAEQNATRDAVPGFDSEAHRAFMRGLG